MSADHHTRTITESVEPAFARALSLEHLNEHEVELDPLQTHPRECTQEEEMQKTSYHRTSSLQIYLQQTFNQSAKNKTSLEM